MKTIAAIVLSLALAACVSPRTADSPVVVATYDGTVADGVLSLTVRAPDGRVVQAVVTQLPTQGSGSSGTTTPTPDTVLLHQATPRSLDGACNLPPYGDVGVPVPFQGICAPLQFINGYSGNRIRHAYVQLTSLVYDGPTVGGTVTTYVKAASDPVLGVDNTLGLWSYGSLRPLGSPNDRRTVNWFFQTTDPGPAARFHFTAVAMGELAAP